MNTVTITDDNDTLIVENPGIELSIIRQQKGYTTEYVANKLHLRVRIIELIEQGAFNSLPEPVFVRGYLRAYSKLLGVSPEPFLSVYNTQFANDKTIERALWQSKRESYKAEHFVRWFTILFAMGVLVIIGLWWHNNRDMQSAYPTSTDKELTQELSLDHVPNKEISASDISKMQALLNTNPEMSSLESTID